MTPYALMAVVQEVAEEAPTDWSQLWGVIILLAAFLVGKLCFPNCD